MPNTIHTQTGGYKTPTITDTKLVDNQEQLPYKIIDTIENLFHVIFLDSENFHGNIGQIIEEANTKLLENISKNDYKFFYGIFTEILENIQRHAIINFANGSEARQSEFIVEKGKNQHKIKVINYCEPKDYQKLQNLSTQINSCGYQGIKELFKEQCQNLEISEKGGAGLGILKIAKSITRLNPDRIFDIMTVKPLKNENSSSEKINKIEITFTVPFPGQSTK